MADWRKAADEAGMLWQSVHAPFDKIHRMWSENEEKAEGVLATLCRCLEDCARAGVGIMVCHTYLGFGEEKPPFEKGFSRFDRLVERARELGVRIAFENTEGIEFFLALMKRYEKEECVGFCWDSGHELCYNHSRDLLSEWGHKLIATHLNDNLGIRDFSGTITWIDDLHLLPFDGITDWDRVAKRLKESADPGVLTFELNKRSKPDRLDNEIYRFYTDEEYVTLAYQRACRVAAKLLF